jgi:hypothetical protein
MIRIVNLKGVSVYPIFKNGKSAIEHYADEHKCKWLFNEQCGRANPITVFLRRPKERFISGVHTYLEYEKRKTSNIDEEELFDLIERKKITNEHFMPQFDWLERLQEYYNGIVILKTVEDLRNLIPNRESPRIPEMDRARRQRISDITYDLKKDHMLYNNYVGAHLPLKLLLGRINHALS